jgi:thiamine-phosphate pyrophosphorylase
MELKKSISQWRLYVITDEELSHGRSHVEIAKAAILGGADVIQLRDKRAGSRNLYETALQIRKLTNEVGVQFIVNDRLDIALAVNADGLHVGQDDLPTAVAREYLGPRKILGVSIRTVEEALLAEKDGADYLGAGPVFEARSTKADAGEPRGIQLIRNICSKIALPIVAIGGINHENISSVIEAGAQCAAVISAVVSAQNIADATRSLKNKIAGAASR